MGRGDERKGDTEDQMEMWVVRKSHVQSWTRVMKRKQRGGSNGHDESWGYELGERCGVQTNGNREEVC